MIGRLCVKENSKLRIKLVTTREGFVKVILFFNIKIQKFKYNEYNNVKVDAFTLKAE